MNRPTIPLEEIAGLGKEIYQRDIRLIVEADHHDEVVASDVDSGKWTVGDRVSYPVPGNDGGNGTSLRQHWPGDSRRRQ